MYTNVIIAGSDGVCVQGIKDILESCHELPRSVSLCYSGNDLLRMIHAQNVDIVICDATLSGTGCFEIMQQLRIQRENSVQFIVYGPREFDYVYRSLRCGATDYVPLPIDAEELTTAMEKVTELASGKNGDTASRLFYLDDKCLESLRYQNLSVEHINRLYGTRFTEGVFFMVFVKYDSAQAFERPSMYDFQIEETANTVLRMFDELCDDLIMANKSDGVMVLLNYKNYNRNIVKRKVQELYTELKKQNRDFDVTICCSNEITDPCNVLQIKEQVRDVEWNRMVYGTNRILHWFDNSIAVDLKAQNKLNRIYALARTGVETLNTPALTDALTGFYNLPSQILLSREARLMFKQIVYLPFEIYWDTIEKFADTATTYDRIAYYSHLCTSFEVHQKKIVGEYCKLLQSISRTVERRYSQPISSAIMYIAANIDRHLSLQIVADEVHLSQSYFSYLFKKEVKVNFSEYVSEKKNEHACELLRNPDLNISSVAFQMGFTDMRAFSKKFRAMNNMTPTRYRQLHMTK